MTLSSSPVKWEPPVFTVHDFFPKRTKYAVAVTVWNEGDRIRRQLERMKPRAHLADIIIADGASSDGATDPVFLQKMGVRTLLSTPEPGLSTATRMAVAYAIEQGYAGLITVDGNDKDGVEALPRFIEGLDNGFDLVQGSRFAKGGLHENTPWSRFIAIRFIMAPLMATACGFWYTDPTNAFRALSRRFLTDDRIQPVRRIFVRFNLQLYFIYRAARLGFRVKEIPVLRVYPAHGPIPTKITSWKLEWINFSELIATILGRYNP